MGQARLRGTPEQRRSAAIERVEAERAEARRKRDELAIAIEAERKERLQKRLAECKTEGERKAVLIGHGRRGKSSLGLVLACAAMAGLLR